MGAIRDGRPCVRKAVGWEPQRPAEAAKASGAIVGFLRRNNNAKPDYTALQIQTSTSILPIPIVWGRNKISPNLIWYENFRAIAAGSGKGIGGKGGAFGAGAGAADYTYTADLIMALCEGPIAGVGLIWKDLSIYVPLEIGLGIFNGTTGRRSLGELDTISAIQPRSATTISRS